MTNITTHTASAIIKAGEITTVSTGIGASIMGALNMNAAGIGVIIAIVSLVVTVAMNWYWKSKTYNLAKEMYK